MNGKEDNMEFYETKQGRIFFENTLPQIAKSLEKIAESLSTPTPCIRMVQEIPKDFLKDLYWGKYDPSGEPDSRETSQYSAEIRVAQEALQAQIAPDVWSQVDSIFELIAKRNCIDRAEAYELGYRAAITMLAAGLSKPDSKEAA